MEPTPDTVKVPRTARTPTPKTTPATNTPPKAKLRGFKDQIEFLRQHCQQRVACARSIVDSARQLSSLTPDELKQLRAEAPRCVERCRR
ncbi:MAG: hypothetical protein FJ137_21875 [Deltaproteobacteria bacterium]|nr:hypothetical protein [Deltaproteobacteria bacterium]